MCAQSNLTCQGILTKGLVILSILDYQGLQLRSEQGVTICNCIENNQVYYQPVYFRELTTPEYWNQNRSRW